jgi:hypothetical protein
MFIYFGLTIIRPPKFYERYMKVIEF